MFAKLGTSGTSATSNSPAAAIGLLFVIDLSALAAGVGNSGLDVTHAAMPKKVAAIKYRLFMVSTLLYAEISIRRGEAQRAWGPSGGLPWLLGGSEDP